MKKLTNIDLAEVLKNDVKAFNNYRDSFPHQKIDFTEFNFKHCNLNGANLSNINLKGVDFRGADVALANFDNSILHDSDFRSIFDEDEGEYRDSNILKSNINLDDYYIRTISEADEIDLYRQYENWEYVPKESVFKTMIRRKTHKLTIKVDPKVHREWSKESDRRFQEEIEKDLDNKLNEKKYFYPFYLYFIFCFIYLFWWILR